MAFHGLPHGPSTAFHTGLPHELCTDLLRPSIRYYTARSLADGRTLPPAVVSPWRWSAWWRNTLRLGAEMGARFGEGLLNAVGEVQIASDCF